MVKRDLENSAPSGLRGRRAVQAEQTRAEILGAARRQFAARGYSATSVKQIAADAGVSVQTLYDSVGSKADLVRRLNDLIDAEAEIGEIAMRIGVETDPAVIVGLPAMITRRILERCSDILRTCLDGSRAEPDLAHVLDEGGRRHRIGCRAFAERLEALDALDPELTLDEAATTIAVLVDYRLGLLMLDDHGFDLDRVERWMAATTKRAVLPRDGMGA
jgi:AcrR family transcriptional regulator